jgi:site-specific recombinase XerD
MNLQALIERYVAFKRALGERCETAARHLRAFSRAVGEKTSVTDIRRHQVVAFLNGPAPVTRSWHARYFALRGLYRYALSRGFVSDDPLPKVVPKAPPRFVPHIYSHEELGRLLATALETPDPRRLTEPITLRTVLLLLYGAGLRVGEALGLACADVDLAAAVLTIRDTKFFKSRLVPFGPTLGQALAGYAAWRQANHPSPDPQAPFFVGRRGLRLRQFGFGEAFRWVLKRAGVSRRDGVRHRPRLHDLRHTFAVHRLTAWYRQGADVQRLLPQLSVYLGHAHLSSTQVYLSMTPELLQQAAVRFEQYTLSEDNHD